MMNEKKNSLELYDLNSLQLGKKKYKNIEFIELKSRNQIILIDEVFLRNHISQKINPVLNEEIYFIDLEFNRNNNLLVFFQQFEQKILELFENDNYKLLKSCQQFQNSSNNQEINQQFVSSIFNNQFDYFLRCKIKNDNLNFNLPLYDEVGEVLPLERLEINQLYSTEIQCNGIWVYNSKFGLSWNINKIKKT